MTRKDRPQLSRSVLQPPLVIPVFEICMHSHARSYSLLIFLLVASSKGERSEGITTSHVMLSVRLDPVEQSAIGTYGRGQCSPMETQRVQESRKTLHDTENGDSQEEPHGEHHEDEDDVND